MSIAFEIHIPGKPIPQGKLNRSGSGHGYWPPHVKDYRAYCVGAIGEQWTAEPITGPVAVTVTYEMPRPQSHYGTGRNAAMLKPAHMTLAHTQTPDVDKLLRLTLDALTFAGVIVDDKQVCNVSAAKLWGASPGGVLIQVRRWS